MIAPELPLYPAAVTVAPHPDTEPPMPFVTVTNWVRAARLCGIDIEGIFRAEGLDLASLHPETATITREQMQNVMRRCVDDARRIGSPRHFPVVLGDTFAFEYMSDVETYLTTSATLRDAARALEWIPPLVNPYMRFSLSEHGQDARIVLHIEGAAEADDGGGLAWAFAEGVVTTTLKFSRLLLAGQPLVGRVTFRHPAHAQSGWMSEHLQVPIEWGQGVDGLWFDRALLDRPLHGAFPVLHEQAAQRVVQTVAQRVAQRRSPEALADEGRQLTRRIEQAFLAKPRLLGQGLEALADELQLHARTLQRRLKDGGDTHSAIQGRVRYRLACQWLRDESQSIEDIAERLGFSDRRSFTLAFTRWSGQTPSQYRKPLQA
jgi:AraC-like DNA-binding protein